MDLDLTKLDLSTTYIRHLPGKHNQQTHGKGGGGSAGGKVDGKDIREDIIDKSRDMSGASPDAYPQGEMSDPVDRTLAAIGKQQGYDGKPTKGSVDDEIKAGGIEMHRGVRDHKDKPAQSIIDDMHNGEYAPGSGLYGNGYYFSTSSRVAGEFALGSPDGIKKPKNKGATTRAALKKDAKVIDYDELKTKHKEWRDSNKDRIDYDIYTNNYVARPGKIHPHTSDYILGDPGRFAAAMGYDAIRVRGKQDGGKYVKGEPSAKHPDSGKRFSAHDQYVVLNRTAMVVDAR